MVPTRYAEQYSGTLNVSNLRNIENECTVLRVISESTDAVKYFEVGFRSYIAETILNKYNTIDSYRNAVNGKRNSHVSSSIILNGRIKSLLDNLAQEQEIKKIYKLLSDTNTICQNHKRVDVKEDNALKGL